MTEHTYLINLQGTDLYVGSAADKDGDINSPITLQKRSDQQTQYWQLIEQHPTM